MHISFSRKKRGMMIIIFFFPFLAIYQLNRVQLSSATRERLWARSNHHGLNGSTTAAPVSASSVPISSTGGRNRRLSGNPSYNVYNNPPPTSDNNGYRSDSSILSNGRTGAAGESSVIYNNGGSIQTFSNSQLEGKTFFGGKFQICKTFDVGKRFFFSNFMTIGRFDICAFSHFIMNAINKAYIRWPFL